MKTIIKENPLIEKHYPSFSMKRRNIRKCWNKNFQGIDWEEFIENSAVAEEELIQFKELAKKCTDIKSFMLEAKKIQVDSIVSAHFRLKYSHSPFDRIEIVAQRFFDECNNLNNKS